MSRKPLKINLTLPAILATTVGCYFLYRYLSIWILIPVALGVGVACCWSGEEQTISQPTTHSWGWWDTLGLSLLLLSVFVLAFWLPLFLVVIMLFVIGLHYYRD